MSFIELKNITFAYPNNYTAVENVSMSIEKGEAVAIVGQNGAGKTTTVKLMNGLLKPTKGEVIVDGWNTKEYTTAQVSRKVGYVFQNPDDQIFNSDVYKEVEFGPKNLGFTEVEVKNNVMKAVELTGINDLLDENPYNLPFSIRKFVTIASVLAMNTDAVILDEPTAGQDIYGMQKLSKLIADLKKENKTVITITHDMEFVVNNFDRVIVMAHKNKIYDGDKREVFWNKEILQDARLKQPYISSMANKLNIPGNILSISEFIDYLRKMQVKNI